MKSKAKQRQFGAPKDAVISGEDAAKFLPLPLTFYLRVIF